MDFLGKKYELESQQNYSQYLLALGVPFLVRKILCSSTSTVELVKEDEENCYSFNTSSNPKSVYKYMWSFKTVSIKFQPDVEFEELNVNSKKVKSVIKLEINKMIQEQREFIEDGKQEETISNTIVREFSDSQLILTAIFGNVSCKRIFKAI